MRRLRWRLFAIASVTLTCALAAGETRRIFERVNSWFLAVITVLACGLVAIGVRTERLRTRLIAQAVVIVAGVTYAVVAEGGRLPGQALSCPYRGLADVLGSRWPVPLTAPAMGFVVLVCGLATSTAVELVELARFRVATIAPPTLLIGFVALFAARSGPPPGLMLALFSLSGIVSLWTVHHWVVASVAPAAVPSAGEGKLRSLPAGLYAVALLAVGALVIPLVLSRRVDSANRYDPRDYQRLTTSSAVEISPLARLDEFRSRPPETLFTASAGGFSEWRLVGLTRYDGQTWMPSSDFRPIGRTLAARSADNVSVELTLSGLHERWLPWAGEVSSISTSVRTDGSSAGLLLDRPTADGDTVKIVVNRPKSDIAKLGAASSPVRRSALVNDVALPASINELAARIVASAASDYERASRIAAYLKANYSLDSQSLPGHTLALLQLFLEQTNRGRDEQFVASFGVLASAVGLPVRVVVGFVASPDPATGATTVSSRDIKVWPEVEFNDVGWVRFDPVPAQETPPTAKSTITEALGNQPSSGAGSPPSQAKATPETPSTDTVPPTAKHLSRISRIAVRTLVIAGAIIAVLAAYVLVVFLLKRRRRRRRLAGDDAAQVSGAFVSAIDTLVDLGMSAASTSTDIELAGRASMASGPSLMVLEELATRSTGAVFGSSAPDDEEARTAHGELDRFEEELAQRVGWFRWLRAKLSLRSLRQGLPQR